MEPPDTYTLYRPNTAVFAEDGTLVMEASGYEGNSYYLFTINCRVDEPDYNLWRWILHESGCTKSIINDTDLETLRGQYAKTGFFRGTEKFRDLADIPGAIHTNLIEIPIDDRVDEDRGSYAFELVLQMPEPYSNPVFDYLMECRFRESIREVVGSSGKDIVNPDRLHLTVESGNTIEHFILTNDPQGALEKCLPLLASADKQRSVIAAYRRLEEQSFVVIWPIDCPTVFVPVHQS